MTLDAAAQALLFDDARTFNYWQETHVADDLLMKAYDLTKMAPTSANCSPLRIIFVKSDAAKAKLKPHLAEGNVKKTMSAPVCAIFAHDMEFYEQMPKLYPHTDAKSWFVGDEALIEATAFRNGTLQAGYFILAARAVGLDCGPMSGFDAAGVDEAFLAGTRFKSNFLCNIGYGNRDKLHARAPRFDFSEACDIV
jgi:3-hydroxypropanoate dehydrogenase